MINNFSELINDVKILNGLFDNANEIKYIVKDIKSDMSQKDLYIITEKNNIDYVETLKKINFSLRNYYLEYFSYGWDFDYHNNVIIIVLYMKSKYLV